MSARYRASCNRCLGFRRDATTRREINMEATGHMAQFPGHEVTVTDANKFPAAVAALAPSTPPVVN